MKKIFLTILVLPCALLAQDTKVMNSNDIVINIVLESTASYLENLNQKEINSLEINPSKKDSMNWRKASLNKWNIIEPKDSLKIISL